MSAVGEPRSFNDLESVLIAAADEFLLRGYDAARIGHIAAAAGLSKSSLYHHVEGKEQLLALGSDRALAGLERGFAEARRLPDPAESVRRLIELVIEDMTDRARLPFVALLIGVRGNSELERRALDERRRYDRELAALLERGQAGGAIRVDVPADVLARLCFGTLNSLHSWVRPDHPDVVSIRSAATAYVLAGITATR